GVVRALSRHQKPFVKPRKKRVRAYTNRQMMKRPWIVKHQPRPQALVLRGARRLTLAFSGRQDAGTVGADPVGRWHYLFARLAEHLSVLASEVERAIGKPAAQGRKSHTGDDLRRLPLHLRKSNLERLLARRPRSAPRATRQERASA
ncbi:hypothetical protein V3593_41880, partial [Bradyrhizobium diazoefficiens]